MEAKWTRRSFLAAGGAVAAGGSLLTSQLAWAESTRPPDEDGSQLWLRYPTVDRDDLLQAYRKSFTEIADVTDGAVLRSAIGELRAGLDGLLDTKITIVDSPTRDGAVVIGTPDSSPIVRDHLAADELRELGPEGYLIRRARVSGSTVVLIGSSGERGVLHGVFGLLRLLQTQSSVDHLDIADRPVNALRLVNHWDNIDGSVERGYAGDSVFDWHGLPELLPRYTTYARALASVGINGAVINNVNANPRFLSSEMITNLVPLAELLRAWGVKLFLSANFASPMSLGGLETADPFDPAVQQWWQDKAAEIYRQIPDFGGFLIKANSEGQPGPIDYGRTHADGANLLADAVRSHGGIVIWRAFIWHGPADWADEAYLTFTPLDGDFAENAIVQIKNGPIDFQVREPVHPLFGAMPRTNSMLELQITQEYTGQTTHLCYLVPQWKQVYDFDTHADGPGSTVTNIVSGRTFDYRHSGVAGVMNFGDDVNWTRHHLAAANTHGYGRLAWNPDLGAEQIADEWVRMTFGSRPEMMRTLVPMLLSSWSIYESYNSPLGAGFVQGGGDHFHPCLECNEPWHQSDEHGIGYDRTVATGTGTTAHWQPPVAEVFESVQRCPEELLLFFHHVGWEHRLDSGKTVIQHIYDSHFDGVTDAAKLRSRWRSLRPRIDQRRYQEVLERFDRQVEHAALWRDRLLSYWFAKSRILDRRRGWVQAQFPRSRTTIFNGQQQTLSFMIGNATGRSRTLTYTLDAPEGWTSSTARVELSAREVVEVEVTTTPGGPPQAGVVWSSVSAPGVDELRDFAEVLTAPAGAECVLALDAGTASSPLVDGYRRLTGDDGWDPERGFGWVGDKPQSRDRQTPDALLRDFVNDIPARTLRIAVPAGRHHLYLLTGDATVASRPMFVHTGGELLDEVPLLFGGQFAWMSGELDGGTDGREVDLEFSGIPDEHWHLGALALVAA